MKKLSVRDITIIALFIVINFVGAFIAIALKLPIFIDSVGTICSAFLFGPVVGGITGIITSLINGFTFDPVSLYFLPVQFIIGVSSGILYKKGLYNKYKVIIGILIMTLLSSTVAAIISTFIFEGITSSGITYIILALKGAGVSVFKSVFSTQFIFDIVDKSASVVLSILILKSIPKEIKLKISAIKG